MEGGRLSTLHLKKKLTQCFFVVPRVWKPFDEVKWASIMTQLSFTQNLIHSCVIIRKKMTLTGVLLKWLRINTSESDTVTLFRNKYCISSHYDGFSIVRGRLFHSELLSYCIFRVGRKIVTKNPNVEDEEGDSDLLEITHEYKPSNGSAPDRLSVIASSRGFQRLQQNHESSNENEDDVTFDLMEIEIVPYGQPFDCSMNIQVFIL